MSSLRTALFNNNNDMTPDEFKAKIYSIEKPPHWREG